MSSALPVEVSPLAARHIRALESWWRMNRSAAPNAVREELQRVLRIITVTPFVGHLATDVDLENVRRVHISLEELARHLEAVGGCRALHCASS